MARGSSAKAFELVLDVAATDLKPPEFQKYVAKFARRTLAEYVAARSDVPQVVTYVDGRLGASEETVKYGGVIRYEFGAGSLIVVAALQWLQAEARKVGTEYAEGFFVGVLKTTTKGRSGGRQTTAHEAEGRLIPASSFAAQSRALPSDSNYIIGNRLPYNRKVDVQMMGGRSMSFAIDDKIFDRCAAAMRGRFPGFDVRRVYTLTFSGQYELVNGPRAGRPVHSPGLVISRI